MLAREVWNVAANQLDDEELAIGYFQQDGALAFHMYTKVS